MKKLNDYIDRDEEISRRPYQWRPPKQVRKIATDLAKKMGCSVNQVLSAAVLKVATENRVVKNFKLREKA